MLTLDRAYLESVGLGDLRHDEMNGLLSAVYEELETRVGRMCAEQMTDRELDEFEAAIDDEDEALALALLERSVPDYADFVARQLDGLTDELRQRVPSVRRALGLPAGAPPPSAPGFRALSVSRRARSSVLTDTKRKDQHMEGKSDGMVLKEFFGLRPGTTSRDFLEELKALSLAEKAELATLVREAMGLPKEVVAA